MRAEITALTVSIMINAAALGSFESVGSGQSFQLAAHQQIESRPGAIQFEFVEAPPVLTPQKPKKTDKISDHDSVARDASKKVLSAAQQTAPKLKVEGPSDQLAQRRFEPNQIPASASKPSSQKPETPEAVKTQDTELGMIAAEKVEPPKETASLPSPASSAQMPLQGAGGADRITTQPVSRAGSHGAELSGATSFEATGSGMGKYMKDLKDKIWLAWFPYLAFHYPKDFRSADVVVEFTLNKNGEVTAAKVVDIQGSPIFAAFCVEAIKQAGTFGPLPNEILDLIGKDELEIKFAFHFW